MVNNVIHLQEDALLLCFETQYTVKSQITAKPNLKNDNFAIISLKVKCPRRGDEAVGLVHYILPETSDQCQWVKQVHPGHHSLQLERTSNNNELPAPNLHPPSKDP